MTARRPPPRPARLAAVERALAGLLALLVVLGGVLDLRHQARTRHVRCAEHGELVDAPSSAPAATDAADHLAAERAASATAARTGPTGGEQRDHEHCAFPCAATVTTARPPRLASITTDHVPPAVVPIASVAVTQGRGVYRSAPKTSPPV